MKSGLKFGGRFAGNGRVAAGVPYQTIEFAIEVVRFGSALYEYGQLKKITVELESLLAKSQLEGEMLNRKNEEELREKRKIFQERIDAEQATRLRALETMQQQLEEQRMKSIRVEEARLNARTQEFAQQLQMVQQQVSLVGKAICLLQDDVEWWKQLLDTQFGDTAQQTMHQVNRLEEDIRQLQVMHKNAAINMV